MVDFKALLKVRVADAERPKPLPVGTYTCTVTEIAGGESRQKKTPFVSFTFRVLQTGPDVDQTSLPPNWSGREITQEFYLTEGALWRLREFLENALGLEIGMRTFDEIIPESKGKMVGLQLIQEPSTKPGDTSIYNRVANFVKV